MEDPEVRRFIEKCLATVSSRLSARELLKDPFLQIDYSDYDYYQRDYDDICPLVRQPLYGMHHRMDSHHHDENDLKYHPLLEYQSSEIDLFPCHEDDEHLEDFEISIKGKRRDDDGIFLRLRIADKEGKIFDLSSRT